MHILPIYDFSDAATIGLNSFAAVSRIGPGKRSKRN
jgi:hypothetical protein